MTREEAQEIISKLTEEEKIILYQMLLDLTQNPEPAEPDPGKA